MGVQNRKNSFFFCKIEGKFASTGAIALIQSHSKIHPTSKLLLFYYFI